MRLKPGLLLYQQILVNLTIAAALDPADCTKHVEKALTLLDELRKQK